ncbi:Protein dennd6a, partial [Nowakowskiella sp. JEL0078]
SFSSFPDSNSHSHSGDTVFSFRFRSGDFTKKLYNPLNFSDSASCLGASSSLPVDTDGFTYGLQKSLVLLTPHPWHGLFSHVISLLGPKFMDALIEDKANSSDDKLLGFLANSVLETACAQIAAWFVAGHLCSSTNHCLFRPACPSSSSPDASYGQSQLTIPFLGHTQTFSFAPSSNFPQLFDISRSIQKSSTSLDASLTTPLTEILYSRKSESSSTHVRVPSSKISSGSSTPTNLFNPPPVLSGVSVSSLVGRPMLTCPGRFFELFEKSLNLLWICWELMVLGEPIIVMAETPKGSSDVVICLVELIKPAVHRISKLSATQLPFGGDYRPYFTIQDSDFKTIATKSRPPSSASVVGVTNQVFTTVLENWPNVLRVTRNENSIVSTMTTHTPGLGLTGASGSTQLKLGTALKRPKSTTPNASPPIKSNNFVTSVATELIAGLNSTTEEESRNSFTSDDSADNQLSDWILKGIGLSVPDSHIE